MLRVKINLGIGGEDFFKKILDKESIIRYPYNPLSKGKIIVKKIKSDIDKFE